MSNWQVYKQDDLTPRMASDESFTFDDESNIAQFFVLVELLKVAAFAFVSMLALDANIRSPETWKELSHLSHEFSYTSKSSGMVLTKKLLTIIYTIWG
jgi:hypothetical protein